MRNWLGNGNGSVAAGATASGKLARDGGERLAARHAVGGKAVGLLEVINGLLGQTAEITGDGTGVITQRFKVLLKGADGFRVGAVFQQAARRRAGTAA